MVKYENFKKYMKKSKQFCRRWMNLTWCSTPSTASSSLSYCPTTSTFSSASPGRSSGAWSRVSRVARTWRRRLKASATKSFSVIIHTSAKRFNNSTRWSGMKKINGWSYLKKTNICLCVIKRDLKSHEI